MIDKIIGFLWGVTTSFLVFDYFSNDINIYWWVWPLLFLLVFILTLMADLYSFITDYRVMAETGWSFGKKLYMWGSNKWKKYESNRGDSK